MRKYCTLWPDCTCGHSWRRWDRISQEGWDPDQFRLNCGEIDIRNLLECVARRCPDPKFRKHATRQLLHRVFENGWSIIEH
jgi:hypothetical protein